MKKLHISLLLIIFLSISISLVAEEINEVDFSKSLKEISIDLSVPVKSLKKSLKIDAEISNLISINELNKDENYNITHKELTNAVKDFKDNISSFTRNIAFVGMLVVFISLIVIGFVISLLEHLHIFSKVKEKRKKKLKSSKNISKDTKIDENNLSRDAVVAAITALHLHIFETEEENKLQLTFKRTPISMWKSYTKAKMPNIKHQLRSGK